MDIAPANFARSMDCQNAVTTVLIPVKTMLSANMRIAAEARSIAAPSRMPKNHTSAPGKTAQRIARMPPPITATASAFFSTVKMPSVSASPTKNAVTVDSALAAPSKMPSGIVLIV